MNVQELRQILGPGIRHGSFSALLEPLLPRHYRDSKAQLDASLETMKASVKRMTRRAVGGMKARGRWITMEVPWPDTESDEGCALWGAEGSTLELGPFADEKRIYVIRGLATVESKGLETVLLAGSGKRVGDGPLEHAILRPGRVYTVRTKRATRFILSFRPELESGSSRKAD